jgi:hypothetical protein
VAFARDAVGAEEVRRRLPLIAPSRGETGVVVSSAVPLPSCQYAQACSKLISQFRSTETALIQATTITDTRWVSVDSLSARLNSHDPSEGRPLQSRARPARGEAPTSPLIFIVHLRDLSISTWAGRSFMAEYHMDCPRAVERLLRVGVPATVVNPIQDDRGEAVKVGLFLLSSSAISQAISHSEELSEKNLT